MDGYVLDPKIGISLMPEMVCNIYEVDSIVQVQGFKTAQNTIPYTSAFCSDTGNKYLLLPLIPKVSIEDIRVYGVDFWVRYLPFILMSRRSDMSLTDLTNAGREFGKLYNKYLNCMRVLEKEFPQDSTTDQSDRLRKIADCFTRYNIKDGLKGLRDYVFDTLSKGLCQELKKGGCRLCEDDLSQIRVFMSLFFGD